MQKDIYVYNDLDIIIRLMMHNLKQYIVKLNGVHNKNNIDMIIKELSEKINVDKSILKNVISKYSYILADNLVIDTNHKTGNTYNILSNKLTKSKLTETNKDKLLPFRHNGLNPLFGPFSGQWIHDTQIDDDITSPEVHRRIAQFDYLNNIIYPAQRSPEWYAQRDGKITASDAGTVIGDNHHEEPYRMVVKKLRETFQNNEFTYHGKKYEDIAKLIYEYRMNVRVKEFGMVAHPVYNFLGASPDGIICPHKNDEIHKTNLCGRMLEIKVPLRRKIKKSGEVKGEICPIYYWDQVQLQLECCDLDECDFWQCEIGEYPSKEIFIRDTCKTEPFRSKTFSFEKGCLIQLLPKTKIDKKGTSEYLKTVWESAQFIHPPKIELTPEECDDFVDTTLKDLEKTHPDYALDKVVYWYLIMSHSETIQRDKQWFASNVDKYAQMWDDITLMRSKQAYKDLFLKFVDATALGDKDHNIEHVRNEILFKIVENIRNKEKNINKLNTFIEDLYPYINDFTTAKSKSVLLEKLEIFNNKL